MSDASDMDLVREYSRNNSETAFSELVGRHINLVYSVALRLTANSPDAEDITQAVFIILARKAAGLREKTVLTGWLYETTRLAAMQFLRTRSRRQRREQEAYMQSTLNQPDVAAWQQIAPLLDDAMGHLGETDRNAVLLRFFENKTAAEVAAALHLSEAAAHKRTSRALEKLRKFFAGQGVSSTGAIIFGAISAHSVQPAPVALAKSAVAAGIAKGAASTSTLTLVKGTMKVMTWLKIKFAVGVGAVALLAGGTAMVAMSQSGGGNGLTPPEIFKRAQNAYAAISSYRDEGATVSVVGATTVTTTFTIKLARPNLYRIEWNQPIVPGVANTGIVWSAGSGDFLAYANRRARRQRNSDQALGTAAGISATATETIPATFFKLKSGNQLSDDAIAKQTRQPDEKVGDVDCYVFSREWKGTTRTLWIGKKDFLIRQSRTMASTEVMKAVLDHAAKVTGRQHNITPQSVTSTETHSNIVVNERFSPADFAVSQ